MRCRPLGNMLLLTGPIFALLFLVSAAFAGAGWVLAGRLVPESRLIEHRRWLRGWTLKGLLLPMAFWALMNVGISWTLQPFMPQVQAAKNSGLGWASEFLMVVAIGWFIISSYWAAITLGWTLVQGTRNLDGESRTDFKALCFTCTLVTILPAIGMVAFGGLPLVGSAVAALLVPIAGYAPGIIRPKPMPPMYSRAIARMKFGKYSEAEWEIIRELEKHEDDFEGWMMLANLYATQFKDIPEAEQTILEICDHPRTTSSQVSVALHRLADWHLNFSEDPEAARRALQMICDRLPGTHLARMAHVRISQLPVSIEELREQRQVRPIPLLALGDSFDEAWAGAPEMDKHKATELANQCVEKLQRNPDDVPSRERLARLLAESLHQAEQGIEQLRLLMNMPDQSDAKRAEWLSQTAAWHIKLLQDPETGRKTLERVIREFPKTPQALSARRRMHLLDPEYRG